MAGGGKHTWRSHGESARPIVSGSGGTHEEDLCDIRFETTLNSVDTQALQSVIRGARLNVELKQEAGSDRLCALASETQVGVILHPKSLDVIACMRQGNTYVAVVTDRTGNVCRVRIERLQV